MSDPTSPSFSRRAALNSAWAAPVVLAAVAAPGAAASPVTPVDPPRILLLLMREGLELENVSVRTLLRNADGTPIVGQAVTLQIETEPGVWQTLDTGITDENGDYTRAIERGSGLSVRAIADVPDFGILVSDSRLIPPA